MCNCYYEQPSFYKEVKRKSQKVHQCCECRHQINKGDEYYSIDGVWDGSWSNFKLCISCYEIAQKLDCFLFEQMYDELTHELLVWVESDRTWIPTVDWLEVVSQKPLKCVLLHTEVAA